MLAQTFNGSAAKEAVAGVEKTMVFKIRNLFFLLFFIVFYGFCFLGLSLESQK